jgi:hypothetical protein
MSDISEAVTQDNIAESLLGPEEQATAETSGTETQEFATEDQSVEEVEQSEEASEDWLPSDQDKVFPDEVYAKYAQRYQLTPEQATDPLLRQLLHDKINTDIFVRQQQQQAEQWQEEAEAEPEPEPTQQQPNLSREQWFQQIEQAVQQTTDPEVAKAFHSEFLKAFGVPDAEIAKIPAQQAMQFTNVASKYMLNLISTHLPNLLQSQLSNQIGQAYPGFGDMYERSAYAMAWDRVRNSDEKYGALPAYGSKEFSSVLHDAAQKIPGFDDMQFTNRQGQPLPAMENAMRKYSMLAQQISSGNVDPALLQKAAAAGAKNARQAAVKRSAGNLGSGQAKAARQTSGSSKFTTNQDIFDDDVMEMWTREHGRL